MAEPRQISENQRSGPRDDVKIIVVFYCPNCGDYYGSALAGDISKKLNIAPPESANPGKVLSTRAKCPLCGTEREKRYARLIPKSEIEEIAKSVVK